MENILIVEDDQGIRDTLFDILDMSGYNVTKASDGREGYDSIMNEKPDLVLCDVNMPRVNGFELLSAVNEKFKHEVPPAFMFLTAKADRQDIREGMNLGADDYILKPFNNNELLKTIRLRLDKRNKLIGLGGDTFEISEINFDKIALPSDEGLDLIKFDDIIRCEADRAYCNFFTSDKRKILISKPMKEFEGLLLKKNFIKVHKSSIVNLDHVKRYLKGTGGFLVMSDDSLVAISVRKKDEILRLLRQRA